MDFELTEAQQKVKALVRDFAERELKPVASEIDKEGRFDWNVLKKAGQLGLMGLTIPKEYGGAGVDTISYAIAIEEISKVSGSWGLTLAAHNSLGLATIYNMGNEEQRKKYVVGLANGEKIGAFALTEPNAGSDAVSIQTTAVRDCNYWVLNGTKLFVTSGRIADTVVVMAVTDKTKRTRGITAFIVEKGIPGLSYGKEEDKLGLRGSLTNELIFENCRVPNENMLDKEGNGFIGAMNTLDGGRISIGAMAVGIAQAAFEESVKYAKERVQFGKPISAFQAVQQMLVDMATEIEAARMLVHKASHRADEGKKFTKEASIAKLYASEVAMRATIKAIQIHGGSGYIQDNIVERLFRDVKLCEIGEGTSEVQRMVIAKQLGLY